MFFLGFSTFSCVWSVVVGSWVRFGFACVASLAGSVNVLLGDSMRTLILVMIRLQKRLSHGASIHLWKLQVSYNHPQHPTRVLQLCVGLWVKTPTVVNFQVEPFK